MSPSNNCIALPTIGLGGFYKVEVRRHGRLRFDSGWRKNLITNGGLDAIGQSVALANWCAVGEGNAVPTNADVTLALPLAVAAASGSSQGVVTTGTRYGWQRRTYVFAQGAVVGNVAEVGVGWTNSPATPLLSRSLISPIVSLIPLDQLTVTYELRMYLPTVDVTGGPIDIGGTNYNFTVRSLNADSNGIAGYRTGQGWGVGLLSLPAGARQWFNPSFGIYPCLAAKAPCILTPVEEPFVWTSTGVPAVSDLCEIGTNGAYASTSFECNFSAKFSASRANFVGGIQGFLFSGLFGTYQCILSAPINKANTHELTMNWRQSWARRP